MELKLWLYSLACEMISDEDTLLGNTVRLVVNLLNVDSCAVWTNEYRCPSDNLLIFREGQCRLVSVRDKEAEDYLKNEPIEMSCDKAYNYARFYSPAKDFSSSQKFEDAFGLLCELFYNELMGGFFRSDIPVAVSINNITKSYSTYQESILTLKGISFKVHRGQLTVIMGPSGCGKSTALNIMGGLLKPSSGEILFKDDDICNYSKRKMNDFRRNSLGFIFQNYNLIADLNVYENVKIAESLAADPLDSLSVLESVGMKSHVDSYPFHLSGGEQQRVCIARALVKNADILLCDEPTGALDTVNSKNIMTILQKMAGEKNVAVVVVTHNPLFEVLADHYIEMKNGEIVTDEYRPFPYRAEDIL